MKLSSAGLTLIIVALSMASMLLISIESPTLAVPGNNRSLSISNTLEYNPVTPQGAIEEIEKRPLFNPTRRPIPPSPAAPDTAIPIVENITSELGNIILVGTIIDRNDRIALVKSDQDNVSTALREGEMLHGWQLEAIQKDSIIFRSGSEHREIRFPQVPNSQPVTP